MDEPAVGALPEEDRLRIIADLKRLHPGENIEEKLAGALAGAPDESRPPVPVWDYPDWRRSHSDFSVGATRFLAILDGGKEAVFSLGDWAPNDPEAPFQITAEDVARMFRKLHDEGLVEWDTERRALLFLKSPQERRAAMAAWAWSIRSERLLEEQD